MRAGLLRGWLWLLLCAVSAGVCAEELLQQLASRLATTEMLTGTFEQSRHISALEIPLQSSGEFSYRREQGVVWHTLEPASSELRITPEQGALAVDAGGELRQLPASELVAEIFLGMFTGNFERLQQYFLLSSSGDETGWSLSLRPRSARVADQLDEIVIEGGEYVRRVHIREANGDSSELTLTVLESSERDD